MYFITFIIIFSLYVFPLSFETANVNVSIELISIIPFILHAREPSDLNDALILYFPLIKHIKFSELRKSLPVTIIYSTDARL